MRILTLITAPFPGERVAGVQPDLTPQVDGHWNVRLNLYTGRALSHTALEHEQRGRAGLLATRGQMVSAIREAAKTAGLSTVIGSKLTIQHHALGEAKKGFSPAKLYRAKFEAAPARTVADDSPF